MGILKSIKECPRKAYYSTLGLSSTPGTTSEYLKLIRTMLAEKGLMAFADEHEVLERLERDIPENLFSMKIEREENLNRLSKRLVRMSDILRNNGFRVSEPGRKYKYSEGNKNLSGAYDMLLIDADGIKYAVKIEVGKTDLSTRSGTKHYIAEDPELLVVWKATGYQPAVYSLCGKESVGDDVKELDIEEISDPKKWNGKYWYTYDFATDSYRAQMELDRLLKIPVSKTSEENNDACINCWYRNLCKYEDSDNYEAKEISGVKHLNFRWTPSQLKVITAAEGEFRVLAGAGSGKTSSLSARILNLVRKGTLPSEILAATFTEKGVREIRKRLQAFLEEAEMEDKADEFGVYTLNSFGYEVICKHYDKIYPSVPKLIDETEKLEMIASVLDRHPQIEGLNYVYPYMKMFRAAGAVHRVSEMVNAIRRLNDGAETTVAEVYEALLKNPEVSRGLEIDDAMLEEIAEIYNEISRYEKSNSLIEYDDQIHQAVKLLKAYPEIAKEYRDRFKHIIIDECATCSSTSLER